MESRHYQRPSSPGTRRIRNPNSTVDPFDPKPNNRVDPFIPSDKNGGTYRLSGHRIFAPTGLFAEETSTRTNFSFFNTHRFMSNQWYTCGKDCDGFECRVGFQDQLPLNELDVLGHGRFGLVKKVQAVTTGELLVLKEIRFNFRQDALETIKKEIRTHRRLSHWHMTAVRGSYIKGNTSCGILIEPVADCDLSVYLDRVVEKQAAKQSTGKEAALLMDSFGCLSSALAYLHVQKVKHKDIKPANVLIHNGSVLITDFGLSADFSDRGDSTSYGPTGCSREWAAPEVLHDELARNTSADVFSLGCVFVEVFTVLARRSPVEFRNNRKEDLVASSGPSVENTLSWIKEISSSLHDHQRELLWTCQSMISKDPTSRPSASTVWHTASSTPRNGNANARPFCGPCCVQSYDPAQDDMRTDSRRVRSLATLLEQEKTLREELEETKASRKRLEKDLCEASDMALPITFRDSRGRELIFPWFKSNTWEKFERLIKQAFENDNVISQQVHEGRYSLFGPQDETILPEGWESIVQPGWAITMSLWMELLRF